MTSRRTVSTTSAEVSIGTSRPFPRVGTGKDGTTCSTCAGSRNRRINRMRRLTRRPGRTRIRTAASVKTTARCTKVSTRAATMTARCPCSCVTGVARRRRRSSRAVYSASCANAATTCGRSLSRTSWDRSASCPSRRAPTSTAAPNARPRRTWNTRGGCTWASSR